MSHSWNESIVFDLVNRSIRDEQVFCSITTQMSFMPQFSNQAALKTVHKENYETSYHRNTAAGNLCRLLTTDPHNEMLILMTVECFIEAKEHDRKAQAALEQIVSTVPSDDPWIKSAMHWHRKRKKHLKQAARILKDAIGPDLWQQGANLAEP